MLLRTLLTDQIAILKDLSDRTVELYGETLDRFRDHLGHEATLDDLDDLVVARFLRWRSQQSNKRKGLLSPASVAKDSAHLRTIWNWCARKRMKRANGDLVAYTVEELQKLIEAARYRKGLVGDVPAPWYWITKIRSMFETGERIGAVMQLRWSEVDLDRRTLTFLAATRKGHRETITRQISADLAAVLAMHQRPADRLVWPWLENRKMLSCYASLKVLCETAKVDYHPFHSIRKATASYLKRAGVSAKTQLGHSSEEMAENHYYDTRITGVPSALDHLPPLDLGGGPGKPR